MRIEQGMLMRIVIPHWQGRVSPVFDTAGACMLADVQQGREVLRQDLPLPEQSTSARAQALVRLGAEVLICGAISRELEAAIRAEGIAIHARICGEIDAVLEAYRHGRLDDTGFLMPGCCGKQRRRGHRRRGGCRRRENHNSKP